MANRLDSIVREMTSTILRTARSTTMAARDFSCCIVSADHELIASPEGILAHVYGVGASAADMAVLHPDFAEGDAFLHNDPYMGGGHAADHQILVPVFHEGEHVMTVAVKAHQIDVGNALPSTYMPEARDVYEEGALIFPCVRVQKGYEDVKDIIRMCERRIRSADIWYGDYLAQIGAVRLAERRVKEFCGKYGLATVRQFVHDYLAYSERITTDLIRRLPSGRITGGNSHDPYFGAPDGIDLKVTIDVDAQAGEVIVDLRDNPDCLPNGLNLTESTATNAGVGAVLTVLGTSRDPDRPVLPPNAGTFRRIKVLLRENCCVGIPRHPASCSVATNDLADRTFAMIAMAFAQLGTGTQLGAAIGIAEPAVGNTPSSGVISGWDRTREANYVLQVLLGPGGGPGSGECDGWFTFSKAGGAGLGHINSVENVEQKTPIAIWERSIRADSEGAGQRRGAPGIRCIYGPRFDPITTFYYLDGVHYPPKGVAGGGPGQSPDVWTIDAQGRLQHRTEQVAGVRLLPGETVMSFSAGGGGYGDPLERDPQLVLEDVIEGWISPDRARWEYGVVLEGDLDRWETIAVSEPATKSERHQQRGARARSEHRGPVEQVSWWIHRISEPAPTATGRDA